MISLQFTSCCANFILLYLLPTLARFSLADTVSDLQTKGRTALNAQLAQSSTCSNDELQIRQEWGDLSASQRKSYTAAVLCLMDSPSQLPTGKFPGAHNRYEDFVVVHMQQTLTIHNTGSFLSWHRYFIWAYEQALQNECGYEGNQPYWDWGRWAIGVETSPIFDGSDTSMSGNGEKISHNATETGPAQNGGGCVLSGPFKNMTVHLGPVTPISNPAPPPNPRSDGFGDNPRCLRRDLGDYLTSKFATTSIITSLITNKTNIADFQHTVQNRDHAFNKTGVHGAGHFTIGADPGGDIYVTPNDPAFFLHHAMLDRVWNIWQTQDLQNRMQVISGETSMEGGVLQKLTDPIDLSVLTSTVYKIKDLVSVVDGPFCYTYESAY